MGWIWSYVCSMGIGKHLALKSSRGPNALPTHDRHAPEPPRASPSPTSPPATIERLDGPASGAAQS